MNPSLHRPLVLTLMGLMGLTTSALHAQVAPNAGQLLHQVQPPVQPPQPQEATPLHINAPTAESVPEGGPSVQVRAFTLEGVTALPQAQLQALLAPALGQTFTFAGLQRLCAQLTQHYREAGYLVATAYLPAQQISDGVVRITLVEGQLGQVQLSGTPLAGQALAPLQSLAPGQVLQQDDLTAVLLALRELPGVQVQSTLRPGQTPGASDLLVDVQPGKALEGGLELDNAGNYSTGEYRATASLAVNNPLQVGDQLSLRALSSQAQQRYLMASYQLPVNAAGARLGASVSSMSYQLGQRFAALQAHGQADTWSLYFKQPLRRSLDAQLDALLQFDARHLKDRVDSAGTATDTRLTSPSLSLQAQWQDGWWGLAASNQASLGLAHGHVSLDPTSQALDAVSANVAQGFQKWSLNLQRWQSLNAAWSLRLSGRAQTSQHNLPSAEKLGLGGSQGVRAYPEGEALGDRGWQASAELRWQWQAAWQALAFVDAGQVQINAKPWDASVNNRRRLAGAGLGAQWTEGPWNASMVAAWPIAHGTETSYPDRKPRLWARVAWAF